MRILVLGGTAMLGRALVIEAVGRGHDVTALARGSAPAPAGARFVRADRDDEHALDAVSATHWDAVIDVSRQPGQVRRALDALTVRHWVFISTDNVYADFSRPEQDENSALLDPLEDDVMASPADYGRAKVACEQAFVEAGVSATVLRSGLIGGPDDSTGRSGYWPWRFAHATGPVVVPDDLDFPIALVDLRDLVDFTLDCAESGLAEVFNVTGPTTTLGAVLDAAAEVAGARGAPRLALSTEELAAADVSPWMGPRSLPLWIDDPAMRWFSTLDTTRARQAGLSTRPLPETLAAALEFENQRDPSVRSAGLSDADEAEVRAAGPLALRD